MKKFILKHAMALAALAIAFGSLTAFGLQSKTATIYWYQRTGPDTYEQADEGDLPDECNPEQNDEICALGFEEELPESEVKDSMAGTTPHRLFREEQ